ncbi:MAG: Fur family transcriptional regulator [Dissulfurispiraceae bacterium]|jgi:Fur family peroxide stress response transcriptional regulator
MKATKNKKLKMTPQRLAIIDYLKGNTDHPSAEDVYSAVSTKFPTMTRATVYNTLDTLRERGNIIELEMDSGKKRFDPNTNPHHHLICVKCKKILDVHREYNLDTAFDSYHDFKILGTHIAFHGICSNCRKTAPSKPGPNARSQNRIKRTDRQ